MRLKESESALGNKKGMRIFFFLLHTLFKAKKS